MEESLKQLWSLCIWFFGISSSVTIGIFGWIMKIQSKISVGENIEKDIKKMASDLDEIKKAMIGDYDKQGLITKHQDLEHRIKKLEDK